MSVTAIILANAPDEPTAITEVSKTAAQATVSWTDNAENETTHRVYTQTGSDPWTFNRAEAANAAITTVTGLAASTAYQILPAPGTPLWETFVPANAVTVTTNAAPAAGSGDDDWAHPLGKVKGKWRVRSIRVKDDLIVENGNSTADL